MRVPKFLNRKWDVLNEKEIDGKISRLEKKWMNVLEWCIMLFPNPYLPKDHKEGLKITKKLKKLEKQITKKEQMREVKDKSGYDLHSREGIFWFIQERFSKYPQDKTMEDFKREYGDYIARFKLLGEVLGVGSSDLSPDSPIWLRESLVKICSEKEEE